MAFPDPTHPVSSLFSQPQPYNGPRPKILGIFEPWFEHADSPVKSRCHQVVQYLKETLNYEVVKIEIPYIPEGQLAHAFTILSEMALEAKSLFPSRPWLTDLTAANKVLLSVGAQTPATDYLLAQQMRHMLMSHLAFLFERHTGLMIVTPTSPMAGWPIEDEGDLKHGVNNANLSVRNMEYIWLANFTGCPAITCPVGYAEPTKGTGDIPIGFMAMGEWGTEDALLEWGRDVERWLNEEYPGGRKRPTAWHDVLENARRL